MRTAVSYEVVEEVLVADRDVDRAEALAASLGPKGRAVALDASEPASPDVVIAGCDVVLNTLGPFYHHRFRRPPS